MLLSTNIALYIKLYAHPSGARLTMLGETFRRISVRAEDHAGKDKNSHMYQHTVKAEHVPVTIKGLAFDPATHLYFIIKQLDSHFLLNQ